MKKIILLLSSILLFFNAFGNTKVSKNEPPKNTNSSRDKPSEKKSNSLAATLTITANTTTICPGSGGSATLTSTACDPGEVVQWYLGFSSTEFTSGNTTIVVSPVSTSTYQAKCKNSSNVVTVTSNSLTITIPSVSTPSSITKSPSGSVSPGTNVSLTANGCSASGNTVKWEDNSTSNPRIVAPSISSIYSFKCVFGSCESSTSVNTTVTVLPPTPTITTSSTTICSGSSATLGATGCNSPDVVEWFLDAASLPFTSGISSTVVSPTSNSSYSAKCTGVTGTSPASNSITINVTNVSTPLSISKNPSISVSPGTNVSLTANGCTAPGNTVKWEDNSTINPRIVAPMVNSNYSFKCVFGSCESSTSANTTVTVLPPTPTITTSSATICSGSSATLSSTGCNSPDVVEWFLGAASVSFTSGNTSIMVSPGFNQSYTAKCTGVTGTSAPSNTININVTNVNSPSGITVSPSNTVGPNTNVSLTAVGCGANTVKWEDNSTLNPRIVLPVATASYSFKCVNGVCESSGNPSTTIVYEPCPSNITLANGTNDISSGPKVYQASASIGIVIASNKIIGLGTNVTYNAGKSILLQPGFLADNSTIFKAEIGGCI